MSKLQATGAVYRFRHDLIMNESPRSQAQIDQDRIRSPSTAFPIGPLKQRYSMNTPQQAIWLRRIILEHPELIALESLNGK